MKFIEVEDDLYRYIASQTESIGESASAILRRLLGLPPVGEIPEQPSLSDDEAPAKVVASKVVASIKDELAEIKHEMVVEPDGSINDFGALINHQQVKQQKASIGRFMTILTLLYRQQPKNFANVLSVSGRDRLYFAKDKKTLLDSGATSKPKLIADTPYWVITNSNNGMKCRILKKVLKAMGCEDNLAKQIIEQI